jgi:alpha 1,6-mannosyltransferase
MARPRSAVSSRSILFFSVTTLNYPSSGCQIRRHWIYEGRIPSVTCGIPWASVDAFIFQTGRHRGLQIVQWTIASQAHHPILIDTVRRIVETGTVAKAWQITNTRETQALEAAGWLSEAKQLRQGKKPWDGDKKGDPLSIQEWTGPAVFTDAVLSCVFHKVSCQCRPADHRLCLRRYLLASAGVRESDLYNLQNPLQIGDIIVLPIDGFQ